MQDMTSSMWRRKGSSLVFHQDLLGPLISADCLVSLRQALGWIGNWPADAPGDGNTVLVAGLEAVLEVMKPEEAEDFLRGRVRELIHEFQRHWDQRGLVFGFGCSHKQFEQDAFDHVLFKGPGNRVMRLSESLWNGSATHDMYRIMTTNADGKDEPGGFHVRRLS